MVTNNALVLLDYPTLRLGANLSSLLFSCVSLLSNLGLEVVTTTVEGCMILLRPRNLSLKIGYLDSKLTIFFFELNICKRL